MPSALPGQALGRDDDENLSPSLRNTCANGGDACLQSVPERSYTQVPQGIETEAATALQDVGYQPHGGHDLNGWMGEDS